LFGKECGICFGLFLVEFGISSLLFGFSGNSSFNDVACSETLEFGKGTLDFDILSQLFVARLGGTGGFDLSNADITVEDRLAGGESGFCLSALGIPFGLLDSSLGWIIELACIRSPKSTLNSLPLIFAISLFCSPCL
jgi:hypothetical protein